MSTYEDGLQPLDRKYLRSGEVPALVSHSSDPLPETTDQCQSGRRSSGHLANRQYRVEDAVQRAWLQRDDAGPRTSPRCRPLNGVEGDRANLTELLGEQDIRRQFREEATIETIYCAQICETITNRAIDVKAR